MRIYLSNFGIASILMSISDITSQMFEIKWQYKQFDFQRNLKMTLLGGLTNGLCLTRWYRFIDIRFNGRMLPKIIADQIIYSPLSISFFLTTTNKENCSLNGYRTRFNDKFIDIWKSDCCVWPITNYLNFKFVPINKQPIFTSCIDLGWNTYMSCLLHKKNKKCINDSSN